MEEEVKKKHFVLVHGVCHGAWCWYRVVTLLESGGHRVTALDLSACGIDSRSLDDVSTFAEYSRPLMDFMSSLSEGEKIILVGHSFGGVSVSLAMETFPEKIEAAVFLAAFMPHPDFPPSHHSKSGEGWLLDSQLDSKTGTILFGPKCQSSNVYQCTPLEDRTLARMLIRTGNSFVEDLSNMDPFSKDKFGCVKRFFIICKEDKAINEQFQRWMIGNNPVDGVKEIDGADHMGMLSKPLQLYKCLLEISQDTV
ncbi:methyl esterase 1 [Zostera marina]|uniref:Methyl esterase 1 n=1 Tax=Zostera marina TaxID=29655 RepID=A0A0K9Q174_ZOSMR|nr:methyl esterase 1 [Zostera marina]